MTKTPNIVCDFTKADKARIKELEAENKRLYEMLATVIEVSRAINKSNENIIRHLKLELKMKGE